SVFQVRGDIGQENQTAFRSKPESRLIPFFSGKTRLLTHPPPCIAAKYPCIAARTARAEQ
ncbi:MAG: hypothetical protein ACOYJG_11280, partial [Prevotella sp.]